MFTTLDCNGRPLLLDRARICAILNLTPDSFAERAPHADVAAAVAAGLRMLGEGADMLDIGAESTRPGAAAVPSDVQIARVVPVIEALRAQTSVPISIDTSAPEVMRAAVAAGAGLINDVRALRRDGAMEAAADLGVPVCLMHMQGEPDTMQDAPRYDDVVAEVHRFLAERLFACQLAGIDKHRILVDPGFGFGKTLEHNLLLLAGLPRIAELAPVLVGLSRKSMIGALTGRDQPEQRVVGSAAAALLAVQRGAAIVRVHDVAATRDALAVQAGLARHLQVKSRNSTSPAKIDWGDDD